MEAWERRLLTPRTPIATVMEADGKDASIHQLRTLHREMRQLDLAYPHFAGYTINSNADPEIAGLQFSVWIPIASGNGIARPLGFMQHESDGNRPQRMTDRAASALLRHFANLPVAKE